MAASVSPHLYRICRKHARYFIQKPLSATRFQQLALSISTCRFNSTQQPKSLKKIRKTQGQAQSDPRKNVQYPYFRGDPVQESKISNIDKVKTVTEGLSTVGTYATEKKVQRIKNLNNFFQTSSGLMYEKLTDGDIRLGRTLLDAKVKQPGSTSNHILLEGVRLIRDALMLGAEAQSLYFTDVSILEQIPTEYLTKVSLYKILYRDMKTWSDTTTPSGLLGIFKRPQQGVAIAASKTTLPLTVVLDSLKDPGNVGTLIRTAAAVGCKQVLSIRGTVNLWDGKVLRSSMGGHFSVPLYWGLHWSDVHNYLDRENTRVLLADTRAGKTLTRAFDSDIDLDQLVREDAVSDSDSETEEEISEWKQTDKDKHEEQMAYNFHKVPMSVYDYSQLDLTPESANSDSHLPSVAVVLGGETEGLSAQAKKFAFDFYGHYVTIPMSSTVNSLNTGVAGSILLYEIRRQLLELQKKVVER